jgi:hypothetical protein
VTSPKRKAKASEILIPVTANSENNVQYVHGRNEPVGGNFATCSKTCRIWSAVKMKGRYGGRLLENTPTGGTS